LQREISLQVQRFQNPPIAEWAASSAGPLSPNFPRAVTLVRLRWRSIRQTTGLGDGGTDSA